jgi:hypothetical protein
VFHSSSSNIVREQLEARRVFHSSSSNIVREQLEAHMQEADVPWAAAFFTILIS